MVTAKDSRGWTALTYAVASGSPAAMEAIVALVKRTVAPGQVGVPFSAENGTAAPVLHHPTLCLGAKRLPMEIYGAGGGTG